VLGVINGGHFSLWSLLVGAGIGVVVFVVGVLWGGRIFVRRAPEILAFSMRN
jgi:ABC-2 type transport system permease protein